MRYYQKEDFISLYPGVCSEDEIEPFKKYLAYNESLKLRGPIDPAALVEGRLDQDTPGISTVFKVDEAMVRYNNEKYDLENPLLHDREYAKQAGFQDIQAYLGYAPHDEISRPYPAQARGTLLVSQVQGSIDNYQPIYPGDTLYLVHDEGDIIDLTPTEGSLYRHLAIHGKSSIYNQHGQKIQEMSSDAMESVKVYKPGLKPANMSFADIWEDPDWLSRPAHYYTDEDWQKIFEIWRNEHRQGSEPRYWEDVKIGDEPTITADSPILEGPVPAPHYGMGKGGSKNLKCAMMDPDIFKTMIRDQQTGLYYMPNKEDWLPKAPADVADFSVQAGGVKESDIHKASESRGVLLNFLGRDIAIRHFNNWMGDRGWITNLSWNIMPPETHAEFGKPVPTSPFFRRFLEKVPSMRGKNVNAHGLSQDLPIVKSYVHNKYIKNGEFLVELAWWIETIEGYIFIQGNTTIRLPSRNAQNK